MVKWKRTLSLLMDLGNTHLQLVQPQLTVLTHYFNLISALKKLYPTPPPQVTAPLKSGPKTCQKPPPKQLQEKFYPTTPPPQKIIPLLANQHQTILGTPATFQKSFTAQLQFQGGRRNHLLLSSLRRSQSLHRSQVKNSA